MIILYIVGILVYLCLPLYLQIIFIIVNTFVNDPIPFLDEIIMYASFIKKLCNLGRIIEFIEDNKVLSIIIGVVIVVVAIFLFFLIT